MFPPGHLRWFNRRPTTSGLHRLSGHRELTVVGPPPPMTWAPISTTSPDKGCGDILSGMRKTFVRVRVQAGGFSGSSAVRVDVT